MMRILMAALLAAIAGGLSVLATANPVAGMPRVSYSGQAGLHDVLAADFADTGMLFPDWRGDLLVAGLAEESIRRVSMDTGMPVGQEVSFADVRVGPDGAVYVLTDEEQGALLRVVPN